MVVSQKRGTLYRPEDILILITGSPKKVPLMLGNRETLVFLNPNRLGPLFWVAPQTAQYVILGFLISFSVYSLFEAVGLSGLICHTTNPNIIEGIFLI